MRKKVSFKKYYFTTMQISWCLLDRWYSKPCARTPNKNDYGKKMKLAKELGLLSNRFI